MIATCDWRSAIRWPVYADVDDRALRALYRRLLDRTGRGRRTPRVSLDRLLAVVDRRHDERARLATLDAAVRDRDGVVELAIILAASGVRPRWVV